MDNWRDIVQNFDVVEYVWEDCGCDEYGLGIYIDGKIYDIDERCCYLDVDDVDICKAIYRVKNQEFGLSYALSGNISEMNKVFPLVLAYEFELELFGMSGTLMVWGDGKKCTDKMFQNGNLVWIKNKDNKFILGRTVGFREIREYRGRDSYAWEIDSVANIEK